MRVLHIITGLHAGGAEQQLRLLCSHLTVDNEVAVLTNPGVMAEAIRAEGTVVHHVGMAGNRDLRALWRLVRLVRRGGYDCVHTHLFRAGLYGRLAARLAGVPMILATEHSLSEHVIEGRSTANPGVRLLYRFAERLGGHTVAVSAAARAAMVGLGVSADRISVVPNGVDPDEFSFRPDVRRRIRESLGIPAEAYLVGGVGRFVPGKRFEVLIEALAARPGVWGLLVGDGPVFTELTDLLERRGIRERVVLTGERMDVPALLMAMDLFVSPSPEETYGLAIVEALAAGLPVVYAACPALQEIPTSAAAGAYRVESSVEAVGCAIDRARIDPAGDRAQPPAVRSYDIRDIATRLDQLYRAKQSRADVADHSPTLG